MALDPQEPQHFPAPQDDQERLQRAVEAIRSILLRAPKAKDAAAGQIRVWMDDKQN